MPATPELWTDRSYRIRIEPHDGWWYRYYATVTQGMGELTDGWYGRDRGKLERRVRRFVAKQQRKDEFHAQAEDIIVD